MDEKPYEITRAKPQTGSLVAEAELIEAEMTIRKMRLPPEARLTRKALIRWVALSLGLITPGESRDTILSILDALFYYNFRGKKPTTRDLKDYIDSNWEETTEKTIRYQLGKLRETGFLEKSENTYTFVKDPEAPEHDLKAGIFLALDKHFGQSKGRLLEALTSLQSQYSI
ncbi:MAG: hypothetical protein ABH829_02800 [archaeon]